MNPGPLAPEARIIPLDQTASDKMQIFIMFKTFLMHEHEHAHYHGHAHERGHEHEHSHDPRNINRNEKLT